MKFIKKRPRPEEDMAVLKMPASRDRHHEAENTSACFLVVFHGTGDRVTLIFQRLVELKERHKDHHPELFFLCMHDFSYLVGHVI